MAQLRSSIDDGHLYILGGQSEGTWQIEKEGIDWLLKNNYTMPKKGTEITLDKGTYRLLKDKKYLYQRNEPYDKGATPDFSPLTPEITQNGPALLLQLSGPITISLPWTLILKIDELDIRGQKVLREKKASAIGSSPDPLSIIPLRDLQNARRWPKVHPQKEQYSIYYQDHQQTFFCLTDTTSTPGLQDNWQGNIFFKFEQKELTNTWKRSRPNTSISLNNCREFYWLAQTDYQPEWPGTEQRIGEANNGWQLWHLQIEISYDLETVLHWLSYRLIQLIYPNWQIHLLNPLGFCFAHQEYSVAPDQQLLFHCEPPTTQKEDRQFSACLSLTSHSRLPDGKQLFNPVRSMPLHNNQDSYLCCVAPPLGLEYYIRVKEEVDRKQKAIHVFSQPIKYPHWLQELSCTLTTNRVKYELAAFDSEQRQKTEEYYQFQVPDDFLQDELANLIWSWQPADLPCTLRYEYLSFQGERFQETSKFASKDELNVQWQELIWQKISESFWAQFTLDAASFGKISVKFIFMPKQTMSHVWWTDPKVVTNLLWLSHVVEQGTKQTYQLNLSDLQQTLQQACQPDMPLMLRNAIQRISSRHTIPIWVYIRLIALSKNIHIIDVTEHINKNIQ